MILSAGLLLVFAAMNFKVSAAPFHFWTPMYMMEHLRCSPLSWPLL